jgi:hypothetical protein
VNDSDLDGPTIIAAMLQQLSMIPADRGQAGMVRWQLRFKNGNSAPEEWFGLGMTVGGTI